MHANIFRGFAAKDSIRTSAFMIVMALAAPAISPRTVMADVIAFSIDKGVPANLPPDSPYIITYRYTNPQGIEHENTLNFSTPMTASQVASALAANINKYDANEVTIDPNNSTHVDLKPGPFSVSLGDGTPDFADLDLIFSMNRPMSLEFGPDLATGDDYLTTAGSYTIVAPNLDVSFTAPVGETGEQLAVLAANAFQVPGYSAVPVGDTVYFSSSYAGQFDFIPGGDGISYTMNSVPEPCSVVLLGT